MRFAKWVVCFGLAAPCFASLTNVYVGQAAAGSGDGSSCANRRAVSFFNTAGNWGTGAAQIGAGTTVHLCGTITTALTAGGNGAAGNPVLIQWESGASVSVCSTSGAVRLGGRRYITLDLGNNTTAIRCTGTSGDNVGVYDGGGSTFRNIEIRNGTIGPLTVPPTGNGSYGIYCYGCDQVRAHHLTFTGVAVATQLTVGNGLSSSGNEIDHNVCGGGTDNTVGKCGVIVSGDSGAHTDSGSSIHDNESTHGSAWAGSGMHIEAVWAFQQGGTGSDVITGLKIYNNYIHGNFGQSTSSAISIYMGGSYSAGSYTSALDAEIFNNLIVATPAFGYDYFDGLIFEQDGNHTLQVYNNTVIGTGTGTQLTCMTFNGQHTTITLKNNVCKSTEGMIRNTNSTGPTFIADYNDYADVVPTGRYGWIYRNQDYPTLASWKAAIGGGTQESHSITTTPGLEASYKPASISSAVYRAGVDLTGIDTALNSDLAGVARPSGIAWDMGAYQYSTGGPSVPTVTTAAVSVSGTTTATVGGNVTADGGASVTTRGTCYSISVNPTAPCTNDGSGVGIFTSVLSDLTSGTLYHYRAFATNSAGTAYGADSTFTTSPVSSIVRGSALIQ